MRWGFEPIEDLKISFLGHFLKSNAPLSTSLLPLFFAEHVFVLNGLASMWNLIAGDIHLAMAVYLKSQKNFQNKTKHM